MINMTGCDTFEKLYDKYTPIPGVFYASRVAFFKNNHVVTNHSTDLFLKRFEPCVIFTPMSISFYDDNLLHRIDGPARYYANGTFDWYIRGKCISYTMENYVEDIKNVTNEDILTLKLVYS